jgi:hypothetical protein
MKVATTVNARREQQMCMKLKIYAMTLALVWAILIALTAVPATPQEEPIPEFDWDDQGKAVVVHLHFSGFDQAEVERAEVIVGIPPVRIGNPPLLGIELQDLGGALLDEFNWWHPLFAHTQDAYGRSRAINLSEGGASIIFSLIPNLATMVVTDKQTDLLVASIDLIPPIHEFCREDRNDPDCEDVANRTPVCAAGGPYAAECAGATTNVTLDGSGSSDPDEDPLSYVWNLPSGGSVSGVAPTISFPDLVTTSIDLTVSDDWEGADTCSASVSVEDTTPPSITCPTNLTVECDQPTDPSNTGMATATDVCDSSPYATNSDLITPGTCPDEESITRTWMATDASGNTSSCVQTIEVVDTTPPVINPNAPATITPPDAPISFTATATDNCDGAPPVEITGYDCYFLTKKGKRIDKTESCVVAISGDTITILDSGGVDDQIVWTIGAEDSCGNADEVTHTVSVVNPVNP